MLKLVVLSVLLAVAAAKPSDIHFAGAPLTYSVPAPVISKTVTYAAPVVKTGIISEPGHVEVHEPVVAKVGDIVQSVSTSVSHQSSTIVHSKADFATPVVAPAVKTYTAPVLKTYAAPVIASQHPAVAPVATAHFAAPVLKTYASAPIVHSYAAPLTYAAGAPVYKTFTSPLT